MDTPESNDPPPEGSPGAVVEAAPSSPPLSLKGGFGTAVGAAMLGFEQALRREPPAEILAAEHQPQRGQIAADGDLVIEIPDALAGQEDATCD